LLYAAETFKKLGKVHYYVEGKKNKMNVTLQLFRIALEQLQGELGDLKVIPSLFSRHLSNPLIGAV